MRVTQVTYEQPLGKYSHIRTHTHTQRAKYMWFLLQKQMAWREWRNFCVSFFPPWCGALFFSNRKIETLCFLSISPHALARTQNCRVMCTRAKQFIAFVTISVMCINILVTLFCRTFRSQAMCDYIFLLLQSEKERLNLRWLVTNSFLFSNWKQMQWKFMKCLNLNIFDHTNRRIVPPETNWFAK